MIQNGKLQSFLFELINGISNIKAQNAEDVLYSKYLHEKNNATVNSDTSEPLARKNRASLTVILSHLF